MSRPGVDPSLSLPGEGKIAKRELSRDSQEHFPATLMSEPAGVWGSKGGQFMSCCVES